MDHSLKIEEFTSEIQTSEVQHIAATVAGTGAHSIKLCLGYRRCRDFDSSNELGQDFATVRTSGDFTVGVVADGVSQSFYGHLAAMHVAKTLRTYLWENRLS